jgi:hypothetical protein
MKLSKKMLNGPDLADLGRSAGSSAHSAQACAGRWFKPHRQLVPVRQPAREAEGVWRVQGRSIKTRSMVPDLLLPLARADRDQTLAGSGRVQGGDAVLHTELNEGWHG